MSTLIFRGIPSLIATGLCLAVVNPGGARAQTLQDALAAAYSNNTTLLAARAQLRAVDENVPQALAGWRPTVVLQGSYGAADQRVRSQQQTFRTDGSYYFRDPASNLVNPLTGIVGAAGPISTTIRQERSPGSATATVTQPIFRGGRTVASVRRAENQVMAQRARLYNTEQQVMSDTTNAFVSVIRFQETVRLGINNEQVLTRQLQATNERFRVGEITRTDVAQAEASLARARATRAGSEGDLQTARATYQRLVGAAPERLVQPQPLRTPVNSQQDARDTASRNNPAVVAALFDEAAARDNIDIQMSTLLPTVSVTSQAFRNDNSASPHTRQTGGQVTANLSVPLYQGGSEYSLVRQARQQAQQARALVDDARLVAVQQAVTAWETLQSSRAQVASTRQQIRANEIALDGVQREAIVGSRTTLDVLNQEQFLFDARVQLVTALASNIVNSYSVASAVGRLTAQDLGLPVEYYDMRQYYTAVRDRWVGLGDYAQAARR